MTETCIRPRCTGARYCRGLCGRHWKSARDNGQFGFTPAAPVAAHIEKLKRRGWSCRGISKAAGVSSYAVFKAHTRKFMHVTVARAILAVEVTSSYSTGVSTSSIGAERRVQALVWMGWTVSEIAERADVRLVSLLNCFGRGSMSTGLATRIAEVYEELSDTRGPSQFSTNRAVRRGFAPPAAWEGLDMDDPKVKPKGVRWAA